MDTRIICPHCGDGQHLESPRVVHDYSLGWAIIVEFDCPCGARFDVQVWGDPSFGCHISGPELRQIAAREMPEDKPIEDRGSA